MTAAAVASLGGWSALIAAIATVVGMVTLVQFFRVGGAWGPLNDASSVVLMLALIPVAVALALVELTSISILALLAAGIGVVGMVLAAVFQAKLVTGRGTFEDLRKRTLGAGALVGLWYVVAGLLALTTPIDPVVAWAAVTAGVGFIAVAWGFILGDQRHPASVVGGLLAFVGSVVFLLGFGTGLLNRSLTIPEWNL